MAQHVDCVAGPENKNRVVVAQHKGLCFRSLCKDPVVVAQHVDCVAGPEYKNRVKTMFGMCIYTKILV